MRLISCFASLGFLLSACTSINQVQSTPLSEFEADTQDREALQGNAEIIIPEGATEVFGHVDGFREITTHVRFVISSDDSRPFLDSILCIPSSTTTDFPLRFTNGLNRSWWKPMEARQFQWCEAKNEHISQSILIDTTNPERYIIYVIASTH